MDSWISDNIPGTNCERCMCHRQAPVWAQDHREGPGPGPGVRPGVYGNTREKQVTDWDGVMQDIFYNLDNIDIGL